LAIEFSTLSTLGEAIVDMPIALYKPDEECYENANEEDKWHSFNPVSEIATIQIPSADSSRIKFTISDTTVIREWLSDGIYNKGLYLKCSNPGINYIREIASMEYGVDSLRPQITFRYWDKEDSVFVTDTTNIGLDATIFNNNGNDLFNIAQSQNDILIASGIGARTYLQFDDISSLPKNILVQKAEIFLPIFDEDFELTGQKNSLNNTNDPQGYYINLVSDLAITELDSAYLNVISLSETDSLVRTSSNDSRARLGKYFIQNIVNGTIESTWFSIQYKNEGQDLSIKRFMRTADNPARMTIKYFEVEQSGF
jgi:hypothetical protein